MDPITLLLIGGVLLTGGLLLNENIDSYAGVVHEQTQLKAQEAELVRRQTELALVQNERLELLITLVFVICLFLLAYRWMSQRSSAWPGFQAHRRRPEIVD